MPKRKKAQYDPMLLEQHEATIAAFARFKLECGTGIASQGIAALIGQAIATHNFAIAMANTELGIIMPMPNERDTDVHGASAYVCATIVAQRNKRTLN